MSPHSSRPSTISTHSTHSTYSRLPEDRSLRYSKPTRAMKSVTLSSGGPYGPHAPRPAPVSAAPIGRLLPYAAWNCNTPLAYACPAVEGGQYHRIPVSELHFGGLLDRPTATDVCAVCLKLLCARCTAKSQSSPSRTVCIKCEDVSQSTEQSTAQFTGEVTSEGALLCFDSDPDPARCAVLVGYDFRWH